MTTGLPDYENIELCISQMGFNHMYSQSISAYLLFWVEKGRLALNQPQLSPGSSADIGKRSSAATTLKHTWAYLRQCFLKLQLFSNQQVKAWKISKMSELEQLRQEAEQLRNQIRVSHDLKAMNFNFKIKKSIFLKMRRPVLSSPVMVCCSLGCQESLWRFNTHPGKWHWKPAH